METQVKELMTQNPEIISTDATLREAAQLMKELDCGVLPVGSEESVEGMITDRDIVVRAIANGAEASVMPVSDYMTQEVFYCREDDTLTQAAEKMHEHNVSRLLVKNAKGKLSGIITFGSFIRKEDSKKEIAEVVESAVGQKAA